MAERPYTDSVDHPPHYGGIDAPIECVDLVDNIELLPRNAINHLWRARSKENQIEDPHKAKWYVEREIARLEQASAASSSRHPAASTQDNS